MKAIATLKLLESGNLEIKLPDDVYVQSLPIEGLRLIAFVHLQNDKRLTDLLDQYIEADNGVPIQ
jgi:hypothetical protein